MRIDFEKNATLNQFYDILSKKDWENSLIATNITFNLEQTEWISAHTLSFLFAWINHIRIVNPDCFVSLIIPSVGPLNEEQPGTKQTREACKRRERRAVSLLQNFDIQNSCNLFPNSLLGNTAINSDKYSNNDPNWNRIKPFENLELSSFKKVENIRKNLTEKVDILYNDILKKETEVYQLLELYSSHTPFENKTLSHLITVELFLNSIQHSGVNNSYLSIILSNNFTENEIEKKLRYEKAYSYSVENKIAYKEALNIVEVNKETVKSKYKYSVETLLTRNIEGSWNDKVWSFFKEDPADSFYKNRSYLEFTYIDFGYGIVNTLRSKYLEDVNDPNVLNQLKISHIDCKNIDTRILEYACLLSSSRNEFIKNLEIQDFVPRGLYFLIDIVRRYKGLISIKSGNGEIFYDFSKASKINEAVIYSSLDHKLSGTTFSILIPETTQDILTINAVEPEHIKFQNVGNLTYKPVYISILDILNSAYDKYKTQIDIYNYIFNELNNILDNHQKGLSMIYLDFAAVDLAYINQKIFFYLANTPKVNSNTNLVILNVNNKELLLNAQYAISKLEPFLFRPIPCIFNENQKKEIIWIGIKNISEQDKLNKLLNNEDGYYGIKRYTFKDATTLKGNFINVTWNEDDDQFGTISKESHIPSLNEICFNNCIYTETDLINSIEHPKKDQPKICLSKHNILYLTAGGYYQTKFLQFYDLLFISNEKGQNYGYKIAIDLFNKWMFDNGSIPKVDFILSVTLSGQLLGRDIQKRYNELTQFSEGGELETKPELIRLAHYYEYQNEYGFKKINAGSNVLIVTDVISSGSLINDLFNSILKRKAYVKAIFAIADCRRNNTILKKHELPSKYNPTVDSITMSLVKYEIEKYTALYLKENANDKTEILRINPILNVPVSMDEDDSVLKKSILLSDFDKEIQRLDSIDLLIGYYQNNNAYHSYFFNTTGIFNKTSGFAFIRRIFAELIKRITYKIDCVFIPMLSSIELISEIQFKELLGNPNLKLFTLPRIDTPQGWRFTFPPKILNEKTKKKNVLLVDDGSCSGNTLIQMIDMVSFLEVENISVLSVFCRIEDFQREFFSRLQTIKVKRFKQESDPLQRPLELRIKDTNLNIFFGIQAFIPHFPFEKSGSFQDETETIKKLSTFQLTELINNYIRIRKEELTIFDLQLIKKIENSTPKYFPEGVDKREIIKLRNNVGKLEGYRIYKQHFSDILKYDENEFELIIGLILHEPKLNIVLTHLIKDIYSPLIEKVKYSVLNNFDNQHFRYNWPGLSLIRFLQICDEKYFYDSYYVLQIINSITELSKVNKGSAKDCSGFILYIWSIQLYNVSPNSKKLQVLNLIHELFQILRIEKYSHLSDSSFTKELYKFHLQYHNDSLDKNKIVNSFAVLSLFFNKEDIKPNHAEFTNTLTNLSDCFFDISKGYASNKKTLKEYFNQFKNIVEEQVLPNLLVLKQYVINNCDQLKQVLFNGTSFESQYKTLDLQISNYIMNFEDNQDKIEISKEIHNKIEFFQQTFLLNNSDFTSTFINKFPCKFFHTWEKSINKFLNSRHINKIKLNANKFPLEEVNLIMHEDILSTVFREIIKNINKYFDDEKINMISFSYNTYPDNETNYYSFEIIEDIKPQNNLDDGAGFQKIVHLLEPFNGFFTSSVKKHDQNFAMSFKIRIN